MQHVVDSRSGQHVGNRDDPPKSAYFAFAGVGRPRRRPRAMLSSRQVASTNAMPPAAKRCRAAATPLQGSLAIPPALVQRRYKLGRSRVHGAAAPEIKEPRLSLRAFNKRPGFLRDAGRSQIADRKDLAPGAGPNSNCLARALARAHRAKLCCPVASARSAWIVSDRAAKSRPNSLLARRPAHVARRSDHRFLGPCRHSRAP